MMSFHRPRVLTADGEKENISFFKITQQVVLFMQQLPSNAFAGLFQPDLHKNLSAVAGGKCHAVYRFERYFVFFSLNFKFMFKISNAFAIVSLYPLQFFCRKFLISFFAFFVVCVIINASSMSSNM